MKNKNRLNQNEFINSIEKLIETNESTDKTKAQNLIEGIFKDRFNSKYGSIPQFNNNIYNINNNKIRKTPKKIWHKLLDKIIFWFENENNIDYRWHKILKMPDHIEDRIYIFRKLIIIYHKPEISEKKKDEIAEILKSIRFSPLPVSIFSEDNFDKN